MRRDLTDSCSWGQDRVGYDYTFPPDQTLKWPYRFGCATNGLIVVTATGSRDLPFASAHSVFTISNGT